MYALSSLVKTQLGVKDNSENHLKNALSGAHIKLGGGFEPTLSLVNASPAMLPLPVHDSGLMWVDNPSS